MDSNKPTIVFTTFWDADNIVKNKGFIHSADNQSYRVDIEDEKFTIYSIALGTPDLSKMESYSRLNTIDFLTPTWSTLKKYKADSDWDDYTASYHRILINNKHEIADLIDSLESDHIYIFCCWENTCKGAHCHRHLLYDALKSANKTKDSVNYVYRHGDKKQADKELKVLKSLTSDKKTHTNGEMDQAYVTLAGKRIDVISYSVENTTCEFTLRARGSTLAHGCLLLLSTPHEDFSLRIEGSSVSGSANELTTENYRCRIDSRSSAQADRSLTRRLRPGMNFFSNDFDDLFSGDIDYGF